MASAPQELSFDEILKFMLAHNGKVTNHELVKHFKMFLTDPNMRDEARNTFKKHVNTLASIKTHNNEKWLLLKKKYYPGYDKENSDTIFMNQSSSSLNSLVTSPVAAAAPTPSYVEENKYEPIPYRPPPPFPHYNIIQDEPPPVPPHPIYPTEPSTQKNDFDFDKPQSMSHNFSNNDDVPPKAFPRKKTALERANSNSQRNVLQPQSPPKITDQGSPYIQDSPTSDSDYKISVKERKQMFNRMASEGDMTKPAQAGGQINPQDVDEEDRGSIHKGETEPLDAKQKTWILCAARGDYHTLAKMCSENPKLARTKDPFSGYTAMHWACKRGNEDLVKLIAGAARNTVNERSNGGYTPLHIAMQFRHENVYRLLVEVYEADQNMRDWAGKKPRQYFAPIDTTFTPGLYRKKEGFLRIGSLNVRVKKTTEAFSNFLGVGATRSSAYVPKSYSLDERRDETDLLHKNWGSADNIPKKDKLMPPPNSSKVRRRGTTSSRASMSNSRSTPSTPDQPRSSIVSREGDSDSDSAAGFHSAWRQDKVPNNV